jgi:hypothetical protein
MNVSPFRPVRPPCAARPRTAAARMAAYIRAATRIMLLGATLLAMTAEAPAARAADSAARDPIGLWTGTLVADRGICPETQASSTLQIGTKRITFTPADGSQTLHGTRDATPGRFHAQLILSDMNRKPYPVVFEGKPDGDTISGVYGSPRCRAHIVLTRPKGSGLEHFLGH